MNCTVPASGSPSLTDGHRDAEVAVVTGAASGIGRALARGLAGEGYTVALADVDVDGALRVAQEIRDFGGRASAYPVDVSSADSTVALAQAVREQAGETYALVNCAGWDDIKPFKETDPDHWNAVLGINLFGTIAMTHAFLEPLIASGGRIINIASDAGRVGTSGETVYASAKAGVIGFTKSVAREVARDGVTANCVCPGPINTPFLAKNGEKVIASLARSIPMRRIGEPKDVVGAVLFLASTTASYVTGQVLSVSGGLTMNG
jgi:2-hydroxycyclohexanecarboxyl-CoA dehydrogenase